MNYPSARTIHVAAALIVDDEGRLLLVRKAGTPWFMQPGGKIQSGEDPLAALRRELNEELGLDLAGTTIRPLGRFSASAANEPGHAVDAAMFHVRIVGTPVADAEIAELIWLDPAAAATMPLAPLTRDHVLPLAQTLWACATDHFKLACDRARSPSQAHYGARYRKAPSSDNRISGHSARDNRPA